MTTVERPAGSIAHRLNPVENMEVSEDIEELDISPVDSSDSSSVNSNILRNIYPLQTRIFECYDCWIWDGKEKSSEVLLFGKGNKTAQFHPTWSSGTAAVRGTRVLNSGRHFWELCLEQRIFGTSMMFGVGTQKARLHADTFTNLIGEDEHSWGLNHKGLLWHGGKWYNYTKPFNENEPTIIGLLFDGMNGTLTYYKDGKCLGVAFHGLDEVQDDLFPMICSTAAKTEMTLGCKRRSFVNLQDRCREVVIRYVKNKRALNTLRLPKRLKSYLKEAIDEAELDPPENCNSYDI